MRAVLVLSVLGMALVRLTEEPLKIRIAPSVSVQSERFRLGEIAELAGGEETLRQALGAIELGASPLPGQKRSFTRQQLLTRLRQHGYDPAQFTIEMSDTIQITRTAQAVGASAVEQFARAEIQKRTGVDISRWRLENPPGEIALPEGTLAFTVEGAPRVSDRSALIEVAVQVNNETRARYSLRFQAPPSARTPLVRSGETVQVVVQSDGVVIEVSGVARASGAEGEVIPVYISETQKTIRARVVEKGRVEVVL